MTKRTAYLSQKPTPSAKNTPWVWSGVGVCVVVAAVVVLGAGGEAAPDVAHAAPASAALVPATAPQSGPAKKSAATLWAWGDVGSGAASFAALSPVDALLERALLAPEKLAPGEDPQDKLLKLAQEDPAAVRALMARYLKEDGAQVKDLIRTLLSSVDKPEVLAFSMQLASSTDVSKRKEGLSMLQNLGGESSEVRALVQNTLQTEKSPDVIVQALHALKVPFSPESSEAKTRSSTQDAQSVAVVAQLQSLSKSTHPEVRSLSLLQLAQWDKAGASQPLWSQALTDEATQVRQAAVFAIAQSGIQSEAAKTALLGVVNNAQESKEVRGSALQALEAFTLSSQEAAQFSLVRYQVLGI